MTLKRINAVCAVTTLMVFLSACPASAELIEIQFTGMDLVYDGTDGTIHDAKDKVGGTGDSTEADELTSVLFLVDGNLVGKMEAGAFADVLIRDVPMPSANGGVVTSGGNGDQFGFDLLTSPGTPGWGLALNIDKFQMFFAGPDIAFAATGLATSTRAAQNLPFGVQVDEGDRITIIASSTNLTDVTEDGGYITGFNASGTGSIRGTLVPEPSSFALVGIALAGLLGFGWKKRRASASC
ncbi:MAG: PEP-CTERM sorting domain-containing protein [Candidatus Nealsonbacteria bacterium]|nr:PEP-CTERM sorting domain-containing protein [Candidatus Nealsonbacteria bacterium]